MTINEIKISKLQSDLELYSETNTMLDITDGELAKRVIRGNHGDLVPVGDRVEGWFMAGVLDAIIRTSNRVGDVVLHNGIMYVSKAILEAMGRSDLIDLAVEVQEVVYIEYDGPVNEILFDAPNALIRALRELDGWGGCRSEQPYAEGGYIEDASGRVTNGSADDADDIYPTGDYLIVLRGSDDEYTLYFKTPEARQVAVNLITNRAAVISTEE